jgi:hypothetical protein
MKFLIYIFLFFLLIISNIQALYAQIDSTYNQETKVFTSMKWGVAYTNIRNADFLSDISPRIQPAFHIVIKSPLYKKQLFYQLEPFVAIRGYKGESGKGQTSTNKYKVSYYTMGLDALLSYKFSKYLSVNSGVELSVFSVHYYGTYNTSWNNRYKNSDVALLLGGEIQIHPVFSIDFRYIRGFRKLLNYEEFDVLGNSNPISGVKSEAFQLGLIIKLYPLTLEN